MKAGLDRVLSWAAPALLFAVGMTAHAPVPGLWQANFPFRAPDARSTSLAPRGFPRSGSRRRASTRRRSWRRSSAGGWGAIDSVSIDERQPVVMDYVRRAYVPHAMVAGSDIWMRKGAPAPGPLLSVRSR
jgi:hypothetical protein